MGLEQHVPSLETCRRLKAAGFTQETHLTYLCHPSAESDTAVLKRKDDLFFSSIGGELYAAPILTEILEQLRKDVHIYHEPGEAVVSWTEYPGEMPFTSITHNQKGVNPAEAAALLWLELHGKEVDE